MLMDMMKIDSLDTHWEFRTTLKGREYQKTFHPVLLDGVTLRTRFHRRNRQAGEL